MPPSPAPPVITPRLPGRYRSESSNLSSHSCTHGRVELNAPPELRWKLSESKFARKDESEEDENHDDDDDEEEEECLPEDEDEDEDEYIEVSCEGYRILPIRRVIDSYENTVCRHCIDLTIPLRSTIVCEEVTYGIATEIRLYCNAKQEHGEESTTHSWTISADRRRRDEEEEQHRMGPNKLSKASFTINYWLMAVTQFLGLGLSHIEALLGFLGLKEGGIGNNSSWHTVEVETLGDGEEFITKEVKAAMAANLAEGQARETSLRSSEDLAMNIV
jgi:hypothetical protein